MYLPSRLTGFVSILFLVACTQTNPSISQKSIESSPSSPEQTARQPTHLSELKPTVTANSQELMADVPVPSNEIDPILKPTRYAFESPDTSESVATYYTETLQQNGWKVEEAMEAKGNFRKTFSKDNRLIQLTIGTLAKKTFVSIVDKTQS